MHLLLHASLAAIVRPCARARMHATRARVRASEGPVTVYSQALDEVLERLGMLKGRGDKPQARNTRNNYLSSLYVALKAADNAVAVRPEGQSILVARRPPGLR